MESSDCPALDRLVEALTAEFRANANGPGAQRLLADYAASHDDWRGLARWSDARYTRNLVARDERFELLLLCWGAGQESPIHNHEDQNCWMGVLEGAIEEIRFAFPDQARVKPGPLAELGSQVCRRGEVAFIRDEIGLHLVRGHRGRAGVSLHLYAAPYDACNVYCPDTGRVERTSLGYHSVRGELCSRA
jgi:cysteine dioxygenase